MSCLNPVSWRKMQILQTVIQDILKNLGQMPNAGISDKIQALLALHEVLVYSYVQVGPRLQRCVSSYPNITDPAAISLDLIFATLYSRYLSLASDCINICNNLQEAKAAEIIVSIKEHMDHFTSLN